MPAEKNSVDNSSGCSGSYSRDEFPVKKSTPQRIRTQTRKERVKSIKYDFQKEMPDVVSVHWDENFISALDVRTPKKERLSIFTSFGDRDQLSAMPTLDNLRGKAQAKAVSKALYD